ncbi:SpoIIE family protein phosphatase [Streptomyces sp. NPDC058464]|uniref:ATP-binding SpoIIE family protein phosphatase n=1 Tax=Streptomyces sp. NPDC058464 TaxID=3346511 RepID=UPI00364F705A
MFADVGSSMPMSVDGGALGVVTASGETAAWASGACDPLGFEPHHRLGRDLWELFAEPVPDSLSRSWSAREPWRGTAALRRVDGDPVRVLLQLRPLRDRTGSALWIVGVESEPSSARTAAGSPASAVLRKRALEQLPLPMALFDRAGMRVAVNAATTGVLGWFAPKRLGLPVRQPTGRFPPDPEGIGAAAEHVLRTGETVRLEAQGQVPGEQGIHTWLTALYPVRDPEGRIEGVSLAAVDVTGQFQARRRLDVLAEGSERIGSTLDLTRTAQELAEVVTAHLADFAVVDLLDRVLSGDEVRGAQRGESLRFRRVAQSSVLPGCPESVVALGDMHSYAGRSPHGRALSAGRPLLVRTDAASLEEWGAGRPERAEAMRAHGIHSTLVVPLRARGLILGTAVLCRHRTPEPFDEEDLLLAGELTSRAAVCIDNARRYTRERATSLALQRALLPEHAPREADMTVDVASRYLPAEPEIGTGGDWFDVIPLSGGRVGLVVGDVVGHGIEASATMGRLCTAVRTLAEVDLLPDELLTQLDDLVLRMDRREAEQGALTSGPELAEVGATCVYAVYDPVSRRCSMARAGHPFPVLVRADGTAELLNAPSGPPLGLGGLPFEVAEFDLPEGSTLVFYTDGLLEGVDGDLEAGLDVFREVLGERRLPLQTACETLLSRLLPDRRTDDAALLLARTKALGGDRVATYEPGTEPAAVALTRKWVAGTLAAWGLLELEYVAELVVSELVTNAIRYGREPVQLRLIRGTELICEVSDASSTAPHLRRARAFDEGGRGLFIVAQLTQRWGSRQTATGKTIWAEIPVPT